MKIHLRPMAVGALTAITLAIGARPVVAQATLTSRAYTGLFGANPDIHARHQIDLTGVVSEAYDQDLTADLSGGNPVSSLETVSGFYTQFTGIGSYARQWRRARLVATGSSTWRYFNQLHEVTAISHSGAVGFSADFMRRTNILVNQTVAFSPSYLYGLFPSVSTTVPGTVQPSAPDYEINDFESYSYGTTVMLAHGLTEKGTISGGAETHYTDFVRESVVRRDVKDYSVRVGYAHTLTRYTALRMGYQYQTGDFGYGAIGPSTQHGVDIGVDYTKPLSATRRATFSFALGSSAADVPDSLLVSTVSGRQYRMSGDMAFAYQFGRTWQARGSYRRGFEYVADLIQPVFTNGLGAMLEGSLKPRLEFTAAGGYSTGESAFFRNQTTFNTYTGSVRLRYAMMKNWAANAEYLYYFYDFAGSALLPPGVPPRVSRNGVRIGLTLWVPMRHN